MSSERRWHIRRIFHSDAPRLTDLVGDPTAFLGTAYGNEPRFGRVADLQRFPSSDELWHNFLTGAVRQPSFRLVRAGETASRAGVTKSLGIGNRSLSDVVDANTVVSRWREGDTVVLQGLQHTNPALGHLANNLALDLDQPCQVNAYLSPPDQRGLDIHFDYHDVFVVQLQGSKCWSIWEPLERSRDALKSDIVIAKPRPSELGDPRWQATLQSGDVLYLPRGFPHVAHSTNEASDHLTVGITAVTDYRLIKRALEVAVGAGRFRQALAPLALEPSTQPPIPSPGISDLTDAFSGTDVREWLARTVWSRMPDTRLRPLDIPEIDQHALNLTPGPLLWLTETHGSASLEQVALFGMGSRVLRIPHEGFDLLAGLLSGATHSAPIQHPGPSLRSSDHLGRDQATVGPATASRPPADQAAQRSDVDRTDYFGRSDVLDAASIAVVLRRLAAEGVLR